MFAVEKEDPRVDLSGSPSQRLNSSFLGFSIAAQVSEAETGPGPLPEQVT